MAKRIRHRVGGVCPECFALRKILHRDHIIPKCKGGSDSEDNIQFICANCHQDKTREDLTGRRNTPESRARMSESAKRRDPSTRVGVKPTPETRAKLSAAMKGKRNALGVRHTDAARKNMSIAARKRVERKNEAKSGEQRQVPKI